MQKIYLLLRSNKQTGPYTFEELLQLNLKPFDLVWVDGRSAAWQYPFEIPALKPHVPETPQAAIPFQPIATAAMDLEVVPGNNSATAAGSVKNVKTSGRIFVSVPPSYQQPQFAAVEKRAPSTAPMSPPPPLQQPPPEPELHMNYSKPLEDVEADYASWVYREKTKKKSNITTRDIVIAGLIAAVIAGGYYVISRPSIASNALSAPPQSASVMDQAPAQSDENTQAGNEVKTTTLKEAAPANHERPGQSKIIQTKNPTPPAKNQTLTARQNTMPGEKTVSDIPAAPTVRENVPGTNSNTEAEAPKKKKLREVIRGIFSKKEEAREPSEDVAEKEPRPATNRQATRRETSDSPVETKTVAAAISPDDVELFSNHPDNWMMGVRNLNITLRNRSPLPIQSALVRVKYFDENNRLLDQKTLTFKNVPANGRSTLVAPENKWADHADFELASVTAKDDRYASHQ